MANILATPEFLYDSSNAGNGDSPPSQWNGTTYSETVDEAIFQNLGLGCTNDFTSTEPYTWSGRFLTTSPEGLDNTLLLYDLDNPDPLFSVPAPDGVEVEFSFEAPAGAITILTCEPRYGISYTLTPVTPAPPVHSPCEEIGRATRNHVSAYQRDRVFRASLYANERRCLVTDFNGAIPPGRSIASAVWQTWETMNVLMAEPVISGRQVQVSIQAQYTGSARIRVDATLDNGEVYSAWHVVRVMPAPYFNNPGWSNGPSRLEVLA